MNTETKTILTALINDYECKSNCPCFVVTLAKTMSLADRIELLHETGCSCGELIPEMVTCRICNGIRNGDCDGPNEHCVDTDCEYRGMDKCPVKWEECKYLKCFNKGGQENG